MTNSCKKVCKLCLWFSIFLVMLVAFRCAEMKRATTEGEGEIPNMFPHPLHWEDITAHGSWVDKYGIDPCFKCHQNASDVKVDVPTCASCHPLYPHATNWLKDHAEMVKSQGDHICATQCHGSNLNGGVSGVSCLRCHATYPHPDGWADAAMHGNVATGDGKALCKICHGTDFNGGSSNVSCYKCHTLYPHAANWQETHRQYVSTNGDSSCRTECHGTDLSGGLSGVSCASCHSATPHPANWALANQHGVAALGSKKNTCMSCHGADLRGGSATVSCYNVACHGPIYIHATNWQQTHRLYVNSNGDSGCRTECHGTNLGGGLSGIACSDGHE